MARHAPVAPIGQYQSLHVTTTGTAVPVGLCVDTTSATTITAGAGVVVTPTSMTNIRLNQYFDISGGTGTAETFQVTAITSTTFTATFVNNHSGAYHITSRCGTKYGGLTVNKVGTSDIITIYNGSPNAPKTAIVGIITAVAGVTFHAQGFACDQGLYYTVAGTPGDYTIAYIDDPLGA